MIIKIFPLTGPFAANKDIAQDIRLQKILPTLAKNQEVVLDFSSVDGATQSFIHALISDPIREYGITFFDLVSFRHCIPVVQKIITIVTDYMQESTL